MPDTLELHYDLFALPTAQHRAGLAGLLVLIDTMHRRRLPNTPEIARESAGRLRLILAQASLTALFNELYDATTEERRSQSLRKDRETGEVIEPLRTETETRTDPGTGKETTRTYHVYPALIPRAAFLVEGLAMPIPWLKLWREVVWSAIRGVPQTRRSYRERERGEDVKEASQLWHELWRWRSTAAKGGHYVTEVASPIFLGAQAVSAERVPFRGSPDENLLLHCWQVVMGIGEARRMVLERGVVREEPFGFVITIPDVTDLEGFVEDIQERIASLDTVMAGYRPRDAVLALPDEGGLQFLAHLVSLAEAKARAGPLQFSLAGVEVYSLQRKGQSIHVMAAVRVPLQRHLLDQYEIIRGLCRNLLFRQQLIRNLLRDRPWYEGFGGLFASMSQDFFLGHEALSFATDVRKHFAVQAQDHERAEGSA